jgi:glycosyltransferase involved in cell wall biosynthesis
MHLSIILPTLHRVGTARCLAERFRELFCDLELEIIVVTPAKIGLPQDTSACNVRFVRDTGGGVYAAYSEGLRHALGDYVWLIGDDDYPLDSSAGLALLLRAGEADVIVAPTVFSSGRVYRPHKNKLLLLFFNWCQQGVIYRRAALAKFRFFRRLRVQADHYVNVLMRADHGVRKVYVDVPICVFGVGGLSSRQKDLAFRALRPMLARRTLGCLGYLLFESIVAVASIRKWRPGFRL